MADNYLEKKMEDHRSRQGARMAAHRGTKATWLPQGLTFEFPEMRVLVPGSDSSPIGPSLVRLLRSLGVKVAFSGSQSSDNRMLAQETGARFYPQSAAMTIDRICADLSERWGGLDVLVNLPGSDAGVEGVRSVGLPSGWECGPADDVARLLAVLIHPAYSFLGKNS